MSTKVRTHKVKRGGKAYTRTTHTRHTPTGDTQRFKLRPHRAMDNAKKSGRAIKDHRKTAGVFYGAAAVSEILGFVVFRGAGALLIVAGVAFAAVGYGMKHRT